MGAVKMWQIKNLRKKYAQGHSTARLIIQKVERQTTWNLVFIDLARNKMTEQHETTEAELKQKVD